MLPVRLIGPLYTANVLANENAVLAAAEAHPGIRAVALELTRLSVTSVTVLDTLADLDRELAATGVELRLAAVPEAGAAIARRTSWFAGLEAAGRVYPTLDDAVAGGPARRSEVSAPERRISRTRRRATQRLRAGSASPAQATSRAQRKPMCVVAVSSACGERAAGR